MNRHVLRPFTALTLVVLAGAVAASRLPVAAEPDGDLIATGRAVFEKTAGGIGCAACHGHFALGDRATAPNIRSANETRVKNALAGVGAMRFLALPPEQTKAVQAFLQYLNTLTPRKVVVDESGFEPDAITIPINQRVQFILDNNREEACDFSSADAGIRATPIAAGVVSDVVWTSPGRKATFTAHCVQRPEILLTIVVGEAGATSAQR